MSTIAPARSSGASKPPAARRSKGPLRRGKGISRQGRAAWILALPFLMLFTVFTAWPVISSLYMSFTDIKSRDLRSPFAVGFIGFDNFTRVLDAKYAVLTAALRNVSSAKTRVKLSKPMKPTAKGERRSRDLMSVKLI